MLKNKTATSGSFVQQHGSLEAETRLLPFSSSVSQPLSCNPPPSSLHPPPPPQLPLLKEAPPEKESLSSPVFFFCKFFICLRVRGSKDSNVKRTESVVSHEGWQGLDALLLSELLNPSICINQAFEVAGKGPELGAAPLRQAPCYVLQPQR